MKVIPAVPVIAAAQPHATLIRCVNMVRVQDHARAIAARQGIVLQPLQMEIPPVIAVRGQHVQAGAIMIPRDARPPVWQPVISVKT